MSITPPITPLIALPLLQIYFIAICQYLITSRSISFVILGPATSSQIHNQYAVYQKSRLFTTPWTEYDF
jgi:hypothetical protein